ncbi:MAG: Hit-like protein involved in cell-cycle regulation [Parcubacteria group bacterium LiPW_15]|nr:MAG: Hit-like protein involved in cell-cycle regulation [Parcubacteria group bacterium LiPW_15]
MNKCIFCEISKRNEKSWKVYEDENVYAFLDIHPASKYHTLIIPKSHYENIFDVPTKELEQIIGVVKKLSVLYKEKLGIENLQIINSSGPEAQQDVFHVHFHIVPRKKDDGQDVKWTIHPEWVSEYDNLLEKLK